ncbi:CoA transferase [Actinomadura mexicana]|uniref:CoA transferase n=1 Tax=Actinomadura mexicana TaxID=134959 RepID=UPI001C52ADF7
MSGVRAVELGGIGPVRHAGMLLASLGADVVRVERSGEPDARAWDATRRPFYRTYRCADGGWMAVGALAGLLPDHARGPRADRRLCHAGPYDGRGLAPSAYGRTFGDAGTTPTASWPRPPRVRSAQRRPT